MAFPCQHLVTFLEWLGCGCWGMKLKPAGWWSWWLAGGSGFGGSGGGGGGALLEKRWYVSGWLA